MTPAQLERLMELLQRLRLFKSRERLEALLQDATTRELSYADFLDAVLGEEVASKREKNVAMRTSLARFPFVKSLDAFDFGYQPSLDKKQVQTLATCHFIEHGENLLILGPPGVGKTHCETPPPGPLWIGQAVTGSARMTRKLIGSGRLRVPWRWICLRRCRPQPHRTLVGLIRSVSARKGVTHHSLATGVGSGSPESVDRGGKEDGMGTLAGEVEFVVGVDTHKASHSAAVLDRTGSVIAERAVPADAFGYKRVLAFARATAPGRRVWAIEGTGSFGAGLTTFLLEQQEWVVEIDRPTRPARRNGAKSDGLDAVRAAREALARDHLAQPRRRGAREAIRVLHRTRQGAVGARTRAICHVKALVVTAPEPLRHQLHKLQTDDLIARCARLRTTPAQSVEHRATIMALRATARRVQVLHAEANDLESQIEVLVQDMVPRLLEEPGVGTLSAAELVCAWSHRGRLRSEAAFAALAGAAPIPASSGQTVRHRLNRGGDRQVNRALHTIALTRLASHAETRTYAAKRAAAGKTPREIKRCLKRYLARRLFRLLERTALAA